MRASVSPFIKCVMTWRRGLRGRPGTSCGREQAGVVCELFGLIHTRPPDGRCVPSFWLVPGPVHSVTPTTFLSDQDEGGLRSDQDEVAASGSAHPRSPAPPVPRRICPAAGTPTLPLVSERRAAKTGPEQRVTETLGECARPELAGRGPQPSRQCRQEVRNGLLRAGQSLFKWKCPSAFRRRLRPWRETRSFPGQQPRTERGLTQTGDQLAYVAVGSCGGGGAWWPSNEAEEAFWPGRRGDV